MCICGKLDAEATAEVLPSSRVIDILRNLGDREEAWVDLGVPEKDMDENKFDDDDAVETESKDC
ncbi:hypothetical protein HK100_004419 [Physocladia obscura]|uniref:Uncharacterized protein n=1 Tax=Physocladia obscura TaxID=109957 RepID=A0AAD5XD00_9FUNG|nr:hypothetical protein HK100_004419 [Physocladia obscura]